MKDDIEISSDNSPHSEILEKYAPLIKKATANFAGKYGLNADEVRQTAMLAVCRAYDRCDKEREKLFPKFAKTCVYNACRSMYRKAKSRYKKISSIDKNRELSSNDEKRKTFFDYVTEEDMKCLSALERNIILLRIEGLSYSEISAKTGKNEKSVDNALKRAKDKLKKRLAK